MAAAAVIYALPERHPRHVAAAHESQPDDGGVKGWRTRPNGRPMRMSTTQNAAAIPWWKEPTSDQWMAWIAAWLGWTLDAFDFTIFLLIMVPIAQTFHVPLVEVTAVFTVTLWLRLVGATASGWLADRVGRRAPLMISIAWYSVCNFIAGFSPTFWFLF